MNYRLMTEQDLTCVVEKNIEYYNTVEDCCWTYEKAYKRIHQVLTMEDSMCMVQIDDNNCITGYLMGYFKEFDDIRGYFLEEIVIFKGFQGKGYTTEGMKALMEHAVNAYGAHSFEGECARDKIDKVANIGPVNTDTSGMDREIFTVINQHNPSAALGYSQQAIQQYNYLRSTLGLRVG